MTKTDFAELKEKLTTYNKHSVLKHVNTNIIYRFTSEKSTADIFNDGAIFQHSQDAKTITALLEIIKSQSEALEKYKNQSCSVMEIDYRAKQTLSETTTRLQKLREGKNGK